jgi:prepilin signal peptidase PulO-like enzyme (type II secretory pathway)
MNGIAPAAAICAWSVAVAHLAATPLPSRDGRILSFTMLGALLPLLTRSPAGAVGESVTLAMLVATGIVDARCGFIADIATLPTAAISIALAVVSAHASAAATAVLALVVPLALLEAASRGTWIGRGDLKAMFSLAVAFGLVESSLALAVASFSGLAVARWRRTRSVRFGPHLAAGAIVAALFGPLLPTFPASL